jgi:hypothetical protein
MLLVRGFKESVVSLEIHEKKSVQNFLNLWTAPRLYLTISVINFSVQRFFKTEIYIKKKENRLRYPLDRNHLNAFIHSSTEGKLTAEMYFNHSVSEFVNQKRRKVCKIPSFGSCLAEVFTLMDCFVA